ncbi:MAG: hypothetical protein JRD93_16855 [Deltaproteobacteria bacterium]|nr:hypothetical protein [Deltaproteobacteria bacterium]
MLGEKTDNVVKNFKTASDIDKDMENHQHEVALTRVRANARKKGIPLSDLEMEYDPALLERTLSSDFGKFGNI